MCISADYKVPILPYRSHEFLLFVSNMMTDNGALLMISVAVVCEWMVIDQNNEYNRVLLYHSII